MDGITITINWEYLLGLIGTLISIAYYTNGRFTRLETSVDWLKELVRELKINSENGAAKLFNADSPVSLTSSGRRVLKATGLQAYIDAHKQDLIARCDVRALNDPYEMQTCIFHFFGDLELDDSLAQRLNRFAFAHGISTDLLRRIGAIYFRDTAPDLS